MRDLKAIQQLVLHSQHNTSNASFPMIYFSFLFLFFHSLGSPPVINNTCIPSYSNFQKNGL